MNKFINRILVVVESIDVEDSSGSKANVALINNLRKGGFDIRVYHYSRNDIHLNNIPCFSIAENRLNYLFFLSRLERFIRNNLKINLNKPLEKIFGFSFTLFNDRRSILESIKKIRDLEFDLVLTLSKGGSFRPHHALLQFPDWHHKWMAYMHDPYPMHLYPRPFAWVEPGYYKKWKFIKDISEKAAYSAFPSQLLKEWMGSYFPNFNNTGIIIPHQITETENIAAEYPEYFDPSNFNLLHAGNLLDQRNPCALVNAFQIFLKRNPEAENHSFLILIGGNNIYSSWLDQRVEEIDNLIVSENYVLFDQVFHMQQNTTVNIILEAKSEISPFLPGKFPHCVQADKPILLLGPYYSESRRLLGNNYEYWAENDDLEKITFLIEQLYQLWLKKEKIKLNKPQLIEYLSESYLKETLDKLLINDHNKSF